MEINWTLLAYIFIGLFTLSGFFKGWWKESITTYFLLFLVLLLYFPALAQFFIIAINFVFALIAQILPDQIKVNLASWLETGLGIPTVDGAVQLDPNNGGTWLVILVIFVGLGILVGRYLLPSHNVVGLKRTVYTPGLGASLLGALVGAFNGFLIVSLMLAYIGGSASSGVSTASTGTTSVLRAVAVPSFTLTEGLVPWTFVVVALLLFLAALGSRMQIQKDKEGYIKMMWPDPLGYKRYDVMRK